MTHWMNEWCDCCRTQAFAETPLLDLLLPGTHNSHAFELRSPLCCISNFVLCQVRPSVRHGTMDSSGHPLLTEHSLSTTTLALPSTLPDTPIPPNARNPPDPSKSSPAAPRAVAR